jgi:hypothetical protein
VIVDYLDSLNAFLKYAVAELNKGVGITDSKGVCFMPTLEGTGSERRFVWRKTVLDSISNLRRDVRPGDTVDPAVLREIVGSAIDALSAKTLALQNEILSLRVTNLGL